MIPDPDRSLKEGEEGKQLKRKILELQEEKQKEDTSGRKFKEEDPRHRKEKDIYKATKPFK